MDGLIGSYRNVFAKGITMSGPTLFGSILNNARNRAIQLAQQTPNQMSYSVLLILTDGAINDMGPTIDALCASSDVPLSVIIVGIGEADFSSMEALDGDDGRLVSPSTRKPASRDIVQFVPFSKYKFSPSRLASETLAEIPSQVVEYFMKRNMAPLPPMPPPDFTAMAPIEGAIQASGGDENAAPQFFDVTVSPGTPPGTELEVDAPSGVKVKFIVPEGEGGGTLRLQY